MITILINHHPCKMDLISKTKKAKKIFNFKAKQNSEDLNSKLEKQNLTVDQQQNNQNKSSNDESSSSKNMSSKI